MVDNLPEPISIPNNDAPLAHIRSVIENGPFDDTWKSLSNYETPVWYRDAKFGIFIHWGVFSVPAFKTEWYPRDMYLSGSEVFTHHVNTYGPQSTFGYKDFIPDFTMENFEPDQWAKLFRQAGAQFVVPVAEHHDGFALYDTQRSRWKAPLMGPRRDVFGDLLDASAKAGMLVGASSHRAEHWFFMNGGTRFDSDVLEPEYMDFYGPAQREETQPSESHLEDWLIRTVEIIDSYRPQVLWFDWWIEQPAFEPYIRQLAAYYYNRAVEWGRSVVINYKWTAFKPGTAVYDIERGAMGGIQALPWQNDTAISKDAWGWTSSHEYKTSEDVIAELADVVSKNGSLLLNVGPKPDGTIPQAEADILRQVGAWLSVNGEAIYGTRPWIVPSEGPTQAAVGSFVDGDTPSYTEQDIRFTAREHVTGNYVYGIVLGPSTGDSLRIGSFGTGLHLLDHDIHEVSILGAMGPVTWNVSHEGLVVELPSGLAGQIVVKLFLKPKETQPRHDFLHG